MVPFNSAVPIASLRKITRTLHDSISRVATGLKVMGGNDAASQSLANTLNARAESFQAVESNTGSGIALLQLAESALLELNNLAARLKEIGVADTLSTNTTADTAALVRHQKHLQSESMMQVTLKRFSRQLELELQT